MATKKSEVIENKVELGIHNDLDESAYHSSPGISKHGLDLLNRSPEHYKHYKIEESDALIFGSAFHCLVLEPDLFDKKFAINPFPDMRTKAAKEWKQEQNELGARILSEKDYLKMLTMCEKIRAHDIGKALLDPTQGKAELSAYWIDNNKKLWRHDTPTFRLCRARTDFLNTAHGVLIDLKTSNDAGYSDFSRQIANYRYHVQDAFYTDGFRQCGIDVNTFIFVVIEKAPPYGIGIYELSAEDRQWGREMYQRDLRVFDRCMKEQQWPGYPQEIRMIDLPRYARTSKIY